MSDFDTEDVKQAFLSYLTAYFKERNFETVKKFFSPNFSIFGTGLDEVSFNLEQSISLFERDISQVPDPIDYEILSMHIQKPFDNVGIVACELNLKLFILKEEVRLNKLRYTTVWIFNHNNWQIEHKHISLPTVEHGEDEAYPLKEIEERNVVLERLVKEKTEELQALNIELNKLAITDKLTSLYNRRIIEEIIYAELERAKRYNRPFSVIMLDIDHFKEVNDTFGHLVGDRILLQFASIISENVRNTDICGRWGGEEFLILCPETELEKAKVLANKIRIVTENFLFEIIEHKTASFGVTAYKTDDNVESLLERVDKALYMAKNEGRNRVIVLE